MVTVRRIRLGEGPLYRRLRLTALADAPDAFATTLASARARSPASWHEQADSTAAGSERITLLALLDDEPVGMAALYRDEEDPRVGEVIQFWVAAAHRGGTVSRPLMDRLLSWAAEQGIERLRAWVNRDNARAVRFYCDYGFAPTGQTAPLRPGSELVSCLMCREGSSASLS